MKIKFILTMLCMLLASCSSISKSDCNRDLVFKTDEVAVSVVKGSDEDYKRIQAVLSDQEATIDWDIVKPRLAKLENSLMAKRIIYMLENDIITHASALLVECCRGCSVNKAEDCGMCDPICNPRPGIREFLGFGEERAIIKRNSDSFDVR